MLTEEDWEILEKEFGNLFHYVSVRINLDRILCERADLVQDLRIATLTAVTGFLSLLKRDYGYELSFREVWDHSEPWFKAQLIKYIKTCVFNCKQKKGKRLTERADLGSKMISFSTLEYWHAKSSADGDHDRYDIRDPRSYHAQSEVILEDFQYNLSDIGSEIVKHVINGNVLSEDGKVIKVKLAKKLKLSLYETSIELSKIESILDNNYGSKEESKKKASYSA